MHNSPIHERVRSGTEFGFIDRTSLHSKEFHPQLVSNTNDNTMLRSIQHELRLSKSVTISVAFITTNALASLKQAFLDFTGDIRIITSDYLEFNNPNVFHELLNIPNVKTFIYNKRSAPFHAKGYIFEQDSTVTAIVGSSNLTENALLANQEWNLKFSALPEGDIVEQLKLAIDDQLAESIPLSEEWIADYVPRFHKRLDLKRKLEAELEPESSYKIEPNLMQREALRELQQIRTLKQTRALVITSTGSGKTILSALDVRAVNPERMLFIVHQEQILDQAIQQYMKVLNLPEDAFGKYTGTKKDLNKKFIFATIQSISKEDTLAKIAPDYFDFVLIDEVHRAGASSYRTVIDYLTPDFLLGLTATPERTDGFNIYELFHHNIAYEIRLQKALESGMLTPFHYYGVSDYVSDDGEAIDEKTAVSKLISPGRVTHILQALETYGQVGIHVKGVIFCSRNEEARQLSELLNDSLLRGRKLRTKALSGNDSIVYRQSVVEEMVRGDLDYILTVDIFNEGIDIPELNQVVLLRGTESSIIFTQQIGRSLRKHASKDYSVIIDFIGNYKQNFLIPIALLGDRSLNKESIRKGMIDALDTGTIGGFSSINFDKISRQRVFDAVSRARLDSKASLKAEVLRLRNILNRIPRLSDFVHRDAVDPVLLATKSGNYWTLLAQFSQVTVSPNETQKKYLDFLSSEILNGKRPHELLVLKELISRQKMIMTTTEIIDLFERKDCLTSPLVVDSAIGVLTQTFYTNAEKEKYGEPVVVAYRNTLRLADHFACELTVSKTFREHVLDIVETGLLLARHVYQMNKPLLVGKRYSRKDVCRLLNWQQNQQATIYGYKIDKATSTCPIFITYHKDDEITDSINYHDRFIDPKHLLWFTRSRRTLASAEIQPILSNQVDLHIFAKKDDSEGTDFYYLGQASSSNAIQTKMPRSAVADATELDVVTMDLELTSPAELKLYNYLTTSGIASLK